MTASRWIVVVDRPYYPSVSDEVDNLADALATARSEADDDNDPDGIHDNRVIVAKVEATFTFKGFY